MKRMLLVIAATAMLGGCMIARGPQGQLVMGFDVGKAPESISEFGGAIASTFLGPAMGNLVSTGLTLLLGGGAAAYGVSANKKRKKSDQGREKVSTELAVAKALLQMGGLLKPDPAPAPAPASEETVDSD